MIHRTMNLNRTSKKDSMNEAAAGVKYKYNMIPTRKTYKGNRLKWCGLLLSVRVNQTNSNISVMQWNTTPAFSRVITFAP